MHSGEDHRKLKGKRTHSPHEDGFQKGKSQKKKKKELAYSTPSKKKNKAGGKRQGPA